MAFKSGMHQIVHDNTINYDAIIIKMAKVKPRVGFPNLGWGKKCFIEATFKKKKTGNRTVVEIFSEVTFGQSPSDPEVGYTEDEANVFQGVCITSYENTENMDEHTPSVGEVMHYKDFMDRYIKDKVTCITLSRVMDDMEDMLIVSDGMIERVNIAWGNRDPGEKELFTIQYQ